ncbi:hypothetical protein ACIBBD_18135 [Streptomyces sp. NPDC051315]|uniref:hypothetical protein n=1 Tax=Streptomyces sp. NPDC051315 TaxID=3365650 RepID=UPI0037B86C1D
MTPVSQRLPAAHPRCRRGAPSEAGDAVASPGSDLSPYVTGTVLVVDGAPPLKRAPPA